MRIINLKASSSSGGHYKVVFEIDKEIKVSCNCKAGEFGKLCKHKTRLLAGDKSFLYDLKEEQLLAELVEVVKSSLYWQMIGELKDAEQAVKDAKKHEKNIQHNVELALKNGIPIVGKNKMQ